MNLKNQYRHLDRDSKWMGSAAGLCLFDFHWCKLDDWKKGRRPHKKNLTKNHLIDFYPDEKYKKKLNINMFWDCLIVFSCWVMCHEIRGRELKKIWALRFHFFFKLASTVNLKRPVPSSTTWPSGGKQKSFRSDWNSIVNLNIGMGGNNSPVEFSLLTWYKKWCTPV